MTVLEIHNLTKAFDSDTFAVAGLSFEVGEGEILAIVGASGCGKTTTLRCIAGLERPTSGEVRIGGQSVVAPGVFVPPEKRGIGMVFQSYALWPHKTVGDNIAYGLKLRGDRADTIRVSVERGLALVGLEGMAERYPSTLSGGQQQRVALARSAVAEPKVLLLDEPLSNLDAKLREQMRIELRRLIKSMGMTAVHITHDQSEAMAIADKIIYMRNGKAEQQGSPKELYRAPANRAVAEFVGTATFLDGEIISSEGEDIRIDVPQAFQICARRTWEARAKSAVTVAVRPEAVSLSAAPTNGLNVFAGKVLEECFLGDHSQYIVEIGSLNLLCNERSDFAVGSRVFAQVSPKDVIYLPRE